MSRLVDGGYGIFAMRRKGESICRSHDYERAIIRGGLEFRIIRGDAGAPHSPDYYFNSLVTRNRSWRIDAVRFQSISTLIGLLVVDDDV